MEKTDLVGVLKLGIFSISDTPLDTFLKFAMLYTTKNRIFVALLNIIYRTAETSGCCIFNKHNNKKKKNTTCAGLDSLA